MLLGIISDTHNEKNRTLQAIEIFKNEGVQKIIHLGDFVSPEMVYLFKDFNISAVLGNNDRDVDRFIKAFFEIRGELALDFLELNIDGVKVCAYHGTKPAIRKRLLNSKKYNVLLYGHTHVALSKKYGKTLCINPGAMKRVSRPSVALYDTLQRCSTHIWLPEI